MEVQTQNIGENVTFPTIYEDLPYIKAYQLTTEPEYLTLFFFFKLGMLEPAFKMKTFLLLKSLLEMKSGRS